MDMSNISPFDPRRAAKRRKEASSEKSSGKDEVVLVEESMTSPMHPQHKEAKAAVEIADEAYVGTSEQIAELVSQAAKHDMEEDIVVFGESSEKAEKAGLSPEFDRDGSLIQDAIEESDDDDEKNEKTWDNSPFAPAGDL